MTREAPSIRRQTQSERAVVTLRDLIVRDRLDADRRYTETQLADLLSMSRTPIRAAIQRIADEGLISGVPGGGYVVRRISPREIVEAIELRGMLEGYAARLLAERGLRPESMQELSGISDAIAEVLANRAFGQAELARYASLNARLHERLVAATESTLLIREIERANARPLASPSAMVGMCSDEDEARTHLMLGQDHHRIIIESIRNRQGARAEAMAREHAWLAQHNMMQAFGQRGTLGNLSGASLIQLAGPPTGMPSGMPAGLPPPL